MKYTLIGVSIAPYDFTDKNTGKQVKGETCYVVYSEENGKPLVSKADKGAYEAACSLLNAGTVCGLDVLFDRFGRVGSICKR